MVEFFVAFLSTVVVGLILRAALMQRDIIDSLDRRLAALEADARRQNGNGERG